MANLKWIGSPNFDTNRKPVDRILVHWIVGTLSAADAQFQKTDPGTSAHYGIEDENIHQYVKEENVAYHAGVYAMNQRSIGIEHSAAPDRPASEATYQTSGKLIAEICKRYSIPLDREHILKHSEVKATQCPGTMDIDKLIKIAKGVGPMITIEQKLFEQLVNGSTVRKEVAQYLEIDNPDSAPTDSFVRVISGFKSRITDLDKQVEQKTTKIATLEAEIKTFSKQLADKDDECQRKVSALQAQINAMPDVEKLKAQYEGIIKDLEGKLKVANSRGLELEKKVAELQAKVDTNIEDSNLLDLLSYILKKIINR